MSYRDQWRASRLQTTNLLNDTRARLRESQRKHMKAYSFIHPVVFFPRWLLKSIPKEHVDKLHARSADNLTVTQVGIQDIVRLFFKTGLEIRLTPSPEGLLVEAWYHIPDWVRDHHPILLYDFIACEAEAENISFTGYEPTKWNTLIDEAALSGHQRMELRGQIRKLSSDPEVPPENTHYIPVGRATFSIVRYPHFDLFLTDRGTNGMLVNYSAHSNDHPMSRFLKMQVNPIRVIPGEAIELAAQRLTKLYLRAPIETKLRHSVTAKLHILHGLIRDLSQALSAASTHIFNTGNKKRER